MPVVLGPRLLVLLVLCCRPRAAVRPLGSEWWEGTEEGGVRGGEGMEGGARGGEGVEEGGGCGGAVPSSPFTCAGASSLFMHAGSLSPFAHAGPWLPFACAGVGPSSIRCPSCLSFIRWSFVAISLVVFGCGCPHLHVVGGAGAPSPFVGGCWGAAVAVYGCWWVSWAVVILGGGRGVLSWVLDTGRVPVLVRGVGGLSWPFVVAGGDGGRLSHVVVCWWVRMGRLGWRCSPMDNDEQ